MHIFLFIELWKKNQYHISWYCLKNIASLFFSLAMNDRHIITFCPAKVTTCCRSSLFISLQYFASMQHCIPIPVPQWLFQYLTLSCLSHVYTVYALPVNCLSVNYHIYYQSLLVLSLKCCSALWLRRHYILFLPLPHRGITTVNPFPTRLWFTVSEL